jgi:hypothetical protein
MRNTLEGAIAICLFVLVGLMVVDAVEYQLTGECQDCVILTKLDRFAVGSAIPPLQ